MSAPSARNTQGMCDHSVYHGPMVEILVGDNENAVLVHKTILCRSVPYFATLFNTDLVSNKDNPIDLRFVSAEGFNIVAHWAYTKSLPQAYRRLNPAEHSIALSRYLIAYKAADQLMVASLQNIIVDTLRTLLRDTSSKFSFTGLNLVCEYELSHTPLYTLALMNAVEMFSCGYQNPQICEGLDKLFDKPEVLKDIVIQSAMYAGKPWSVLDEDFPTQFHIDEVVTQREGDSDLHSG